jgi:hypothetical protein
MRHKSSLLATVYRAYHPVARGKDLQRLNVLTSFPAYGADNLEEQSDVRFHSDLAIATCEIVRKRLSPRRQEFTIKVLDCVKIARAWFFGYATHGFDQLSLRWPSRFQGQYVSKRYRLRTVESRRFISKRLPVTWLTLGAFCAPPAALAEYVYQDFSRHQEIVVCLYAI